MPKGTRDDDVANHQGPNNSPPQLPRLDRDANSRLNYTGKLLQRDLPEQDLKSLPQEEQIAPIAKYQAPGTKYWRQNQLTVPKNRAQTVVAGQLRIDSGPPLTVETEKGQHEASTINGTQAISNEAVEKIRQCDLALQRGSATVFTDLRLRETDWRAHATPLSPPKASSNRDQASSSTSPTYSSTGRTWKDFMKGDVFWASWECHSSFQVNADPNDPNIVQTPEGPKCIKKRLWVCVLKTETFMKALPIFSHGDGGINKIPRERQYEDSCISQVGSDSAPAKHPADLSTLFFVSDSPDFKLRLTSTVHLLADKAIKYDQPITMVGHLTGQSLGILKHQIAAAATTADGRYGRLTEKVVLRLLGG